MHSVSARGTGTPSAAWVGMKPTTPQPQQDLAPFPFQKLDAYIQSRELAAEVHRANIGETELHSAPSALRRCPWTPSTAWTPSTPIRDQATRAAKSVFLNVSEALPDTQLGVRRRHFTIARNSLCEVAAAVDLAVAIGALPAPVAAELVGRMQRVGALVAGSCGRRVAGPRAQRGAQVRAVARF
jgi:four helix bundle protein